MARYFVFVTLEAYLLEIIMLFIWGILGQKIIPNVYMRILYIEISAHRLRYVQILSIDRSTFLV